MTIDEIFSLYEKELALVERHLRAIFSSDAKIITMVGEHIMGGGGKRLRPLFLLLSAELSDYRGEDRLLLASIIEAIHTASLLHDDVVDGAEIRRGKPASHTIWGNQAIILIGDFLYANALRIAVLRKNQRIMETLSDATTMMTEGEIIQLNKVADPEMTEDEYFRIISAKTGALISSACRIGGILGRLPAEQEDALARFGMKTGIVFQMVDDILDYMAEEKELGKKLGKDLDEGKITLPLIYLFEMSDESERREIKDIIKQGKSEESSLKQILRLLEKYNSIEKSVRAAHGLVGEAKRELDIFPDSLKKNALLQMADYAVSRDR